MKNLFLLAIFAPLSILGSTRVPAAAARGRQEACRQDITYKLRDLKQFVDECLQERAEYFPQSRMRVPNTPEAQLEAAQEELDRRRSSIMYSGSYEGLPKDDAVYAEARRQFEEARQRINDKRDYLRNKPKPVPAASVSFYAQHKTPIWIGGGIIVAAALCYGVYQLFADNEETPEEKMSLEEHHQKQQAQRAVIQD